MCGGKVAKEYRTQDGRKIKAFYKQDGDTKVISQYEPQQAPYMTAESHVSTIAGGTRIAPSRSTPARGRPVEKHIVSIPIHAKMIELDKLNDAYIKGRIDKSTYEGARKEMMEHPQLDYNSAIAIHRQHTSSISLEEAKNLSHDMVLVDKQGNRWRVFGEPKTWKKSPSRVQVPLKHGLYDHSYLTEDNLDQFVFEGEMTKAQVHEAIRMDVRGYTKGTRVKFTGDKSEFAFGQVKKGDTGTVIGKWHGSDVIVQWDKMKTPTNNGAFVSSVKHLSKTGQVRHATVPPYAMRDLTLTAENEESIDKHREELARNYFRKKKRGVFNEERAIDGIQNLHVPMMIQAYKKVSGENTIDEYDLRRVSKEDKRQIAKEVYPDIMERVEYMEKRPVDEQKAWLKHEHVFVTPKGKRFSAYSYSEAQEKAKALGEEKADWV